MDVSQISDPSTEIKPDVLCVILLHYSRNVI